MRVSRLRIADAAAQLSVVVACLAAGCQPSAPPAKPAPAGKAKAPANAPAAESDAQNDAPSERVVIFAAASTQEPVEAISQGFRRLHPGVEISASFASSATLAKQIAEGASADLFLSASPQWVTFLQERELVGEQQDLLGNELVAVVAADTTLSIAKPEDLLSDDVGHIAVGDPDSVPAGIYAKEALSRLGLWEKLRDKLVPAEDVRHALAMVETGAAEAGIVYATDAAVSKRVKLAFPFESELTEPIVYPLALLKRGADNPAAVEFYRHSQSEAAGDLFRQAGFRVQQAAGVP
jgi:molybdate transport system substrate-binding protein